MKGEWHEGIDYLKIDLPLPSEREMVAEWDPEGRGVTLTLTDGLLFRKFTPPSWKQVWTTWTDANAFTAHTAYMDGNRRSNQQ